MNTHQQSFRQFDSCEFEDETFKKQTFRVFETKKCFISMGKTKNIAFLLFLENLKKAFPFFLKIFLMFITIWRCIDFVKLLLSISSLLNTDFINAFLRMKLPLQSGKKG